MENLLIEVVIGLLLVYIAMALLLMRVQEGVHGGFLRGRVRNMHELLLQACGNDKTLKERVLANPLLLALTKSDTSKPAGWFSRATGPSSVPPDTFVRALLMTLNPSGKAPSTETLSPLAFMDSILKNVKETDPKHAYLNGLRALIPAADSNWPAFETALALWFSDIGDRASGWYKRNSSVAGLRIAFLLCLVLNVDTANMVNTLGADNELRQGLGNLSELLLQQRTGDDNKPVVPPADPAQDPAVRAIAKLVDANAQLSEAYFKDPAIARFGYYMTEVDKVCPLETHTFSANAKEGRYVSNSDTWVSILPALLPPLEQAINRVKEEETDIPKELREAYTCLSHVSAWVRAASTASSRVETRRVMQDAGKALEESKSALLSILRSNDLQGGLRRLFLLDPEAFQRCAARPAANTANMQACVLREQDLMNRLPIGYTGANVRQQFCQVRTVEGRDTLSGADAHVAPITIKASDATSVTIAVNTWPKEAQTQAFNRDRGYLESRLCGDFILPAQPKLGIGAMTLVAKPASWVFWLVGLAVSALFISLGAPILFDTLAQWVKLRNAGAVRDAAKDKLKGAGTMTLPMLAAGGSTVVAAGTTAAVPVTRPGVLAANEGAVGDFEEQLTARELQSVKQKLNIQPSTGGFDAATRAEILKATGADKLTLASYTLLMGRPPLQAGPVNGALPGSAVQRGRLFDGAPKLGAALGTRLVFPGRVPADETRFTDELRALTVLYRFKSGTTQDHKAPIFEDAESRPEQFDNMDDALRVAMLDTSQPPLPRIATAPWLDVALGELGQTELKGSSRATSNARICEYLDASATGLGDSGDDTPWCGAFVIWVLKHRYSTLSKDPGAVPDPVTVTTEPQPVQSGQPIVPGTLSNGFSFPHTPQRAVHWKDWTTWPRPTGLPQATDTWQVTTANGTRTLQAGDVVVVDVNGNDKTHHVGFVFDVDLKTGTFWMLGGNQFGGTRVSLSPWRTTSIV
ncbi:hypothetical protein [Roseateles sp.]|uniref:hypothetical protein n=1 Tax=Roseateles sp. TaxID=1971397 RepID=UPI002F3FC47B